MSKDKSEDKSKDKPVDPLTVEGGNVWLVTRGGKVLMRGQAAAGVTPKAIDKALQRGAVVARAANPETEK